MKQDIFCKLKDPFLNDNEALRVIRINNDSNQVLTINSIELEWIYSFDEIEFVNN